MNDTGIAVVIPVFNGQTYLADAIESVLAQSRPAAEICVVDDASTDASLDVASRYPQVRCLRLDTNGGQAAALNRGVAETSAPLIAFLDADDLWLPGKLELQCQTLARDGSLDIVAGHAEQFCSDLAMSVPADRRILPARLTSALLIRREAYLCCGGFREGDPTFPLEWWLRADRLGLSTRVLDEVVYRRRLHAANMGRDPKMRAFYLQSIAERLRARRQI